MGEFENFMTNIDQETLFRFIMIVNAIFTIMGIFTFLLKARGLYLINKKKGEPNPWIAWIPVIQIYAFVRAAGKDGIRIIWLILGFMTLIIPGVIIYAILCYNIAQRTNRGLWSALGIFFISFIMLPIIGIKLEDKNKENEKSVKEKYDY